MNTPSLSEKTTSLHPPNLLNQTVMSTLQLRAHHPFLEQSRQSD